MCIHIISRCIHIQLFCADLHVPLSFPYIFHFHVHCAYIFHFHVHTCSTVSYIHITLSCAYLFHVYQSINPLSFVYIFHCSLQTCYTVMYIHFFFNAGIRHISLSNYWRLPPHSPALGRGSIHCIKAHIMMYYEDNIP
jgi:hypothetical protein